MKKKQMTKLEELLQWNKRPFLDKMLDDGISANQCAEWIRENGIEISTPTVYTYAKRRKEAIVKDIQMEQVMDKRTQPRASTAKKKTTGRPAKQGVKVDTKRYKEPNASTNRTQAERKRDNLTVDKLKSDMELLDAVMQKGYETLLNMEAIAPKDFLKAIELKHKITGGSHGGITTYGLEEIRLREAAREAAILAIMLKYIPEEQHMEVIAEMERATQEYYESIGLGEAYEAQIEEDAVNE
ncbi:hypothetical protein M3_0127 [Lysinibacillus phage vB_LfM_LysYB1]|nr:hypothetical protein M3_0127 [Lysinibacillus phage vB_LfM_LysYB1]WAB25363.1 hypothetical protein M5_0185 [Lysinibacillus phage vB_LfM_LysYB2]